MTDEAIDYLPISMLNQLEYCERRFYLMHVLGEMEVNAHVLEGSFRHEQAHSARAGREGDKVVHRRVYVWSDRLGLAGYSDIIEESPEHLSAKIGSGTGGWRPKERPAAPGRDAGTTISVASAPGSFDRVRITPVEYKKGRMGRWLNDHVQLCAQALCLEERLGITIAGGYVFYFGSRRRQEVSFTAELRQRTVRAVERARELIGGNQLPPPLTQAAKCRDCSLERICLPVEVHTLLRRTQ